MSEVQTKIPIPGLGTHTKKIDGKDVNVSYLKPWQTSQEELVSRPLPQPVERPRR